MLQLLVDDVKHWTPDSE